MVSKDATKLLLVEDTSDFAKVLISELEQEGYQVFLATDGLTALELHAQEKPDLIILDWMLPKLDGIDVLRQIRKSSITPVLMLSARHDELDRVLGLEAGADDYLTKPFSSLEFLARVKALLRRVEMIRDMLHQDKAVAKQQLQLGPLVLDVENYWVRLHDEALDLSRTEFDLLQLLMRNPNRAFSRAYLLEVIWGADYIGGDRSVDNAILRLRKKLGSLGDAIETVWGMGYRLRHD
jgi:DNA-binding response OmpR family regulator